MYRTSSAHHLRHGFGPRHAADEEARAEIEVLESRLGRQNHLTKEIQSSLARIDTSRTGLQQMLDDPAYKRTQELQTILKNIDSLELALEKVKQPFQVSKNEEEIIRSGPGKSGLSAYLASLERINKALAEMKRAESNPLNQQPMADLTTLLEEGRESLKSLFYAIILEDAKPIEPLQYITRSEPFPKLSQEKTTRLGAINRFYASQPSPKETAQLYVQVRARYVNDTLQNLATASVNMAKKRNAGAVYRQGSNGIGVYSTAIEECFLAEYDNICAIFSRDECGQIFSRTCNDAILELVKTLRDLNSHVLSNLTTDCFLAYEILEIMSGLALRIDDRTGELKPLFASALKPISDTAKASLPELLEDTKRRVLNLPGLPVDGSALPLTAEIMARLQSMADFLRPISSILVAFGDNNWKSLSSLNASKDTVPIFGVGVDGQQLFAHYTTDTIDALMSAIEQKAKGSQKGKTMTGALLANNIVLIERTIRDSNLNSILATSMSSVDVWRKKAISTYTDPWVETSRSLLDRTYTNRVRPDSGSNATDSAFVLKQLNSKEKESIKEKFQAFNASFADLVTKHKSLTMEREVREMMGREIQGMIEALYCRFWDKYHEIDKGKGKYVKYDKASISAAIASLM